MCWDDRVGERKPYPSDVSDEQWALIEPVLTAWKAAHPSVSGHEGTYAMREIINAILYQGRTGVQWEYLPHDLPPKSATYYYFAKWRDDGTAQVIHDLLRWYLRESKGRKADPSLVVLDTQSVHAAASSSRPSRACSLSRARSPATILRPVRLAQSQRRRGHQLANRPLRG
nr:hypothetical protein GCM10020093_019470 [Planobispora longispora]